MNLKLGLQIQYFFNQRLQKPAGIPMFSEFIIIFIGTEQHLFVYNFIIIDFSYGYKEVLAVLISDFGRET